MSDTFKMRPLRTSDIFKMSKILKKMNLKLDFDFNDEDNSKINSETKKIQVGIQFAQRILENMHLAEDEVNAFMGDLVGMTSEEFAELDLEETFKIFELFKEQKGLMHFFKLAG